MPDQSIARLALLSKTVRHFRPAALRLLIVPLAAVWLGTGLPAHADTASKTTERTLANGLKVIVRENPRAPTAIQMIWYRAGSIDEVNGRTGIAHLLEHMMFKGTRDYPDGAFSRHVARVGGRENAFTNRDYTAYYQQVLATELPEMMALEADRMHNLTLVPELFERERDVVKEERRLRVDDSAMGRFNEQLMALSYTASPYRSPVIGWMGDLERLTLEDARDWYSTWYAPGNAVLVIVGDVDTEQIIARAEQTFGKVESRTLPARRITPEPVQQGIRRAQVKAPAKAPQVVLAFQAPKLTDIDGDIDPYALEMLAAVLDVGDTGRLTRHLVREQRLANGVDASYTMMSRGPVQFTLSGTPAAGRSVGDLESALRAEVALVANDGVTEDELARIKTQYVAERIYGRDSLFGQVMEIGSLEMAGFSHRDEDRLLERLRSVTPEQVKAVAARYFADDGLTVVTLDPQAQPEALAISPRQTN